jgi:hypothetical protein
LELNGTSADEVKASLYIDYAIKYAPGAAVVLVALGLLGYAVALALAALATFFSSNENSLGALKAWFMTRSTLNIGIPCSAIAAFAIVTVLLKAFPPIKDAGGGLVLKAFGLEFSGPSGPITLWLLCFLGFVFALKLLGT